MKPGNTAKGCGAYLRGGVDRRSLSEYVIFNKIIHLVQLGLSIWELHASPDERHQMRYFEPAPPFLSIKQRLKAIASPVFRDPALPNFFFRVLTVAA
ncbi:MAG: hypothetical protein MUQ10_05215 [Anaerolineae bacterium]|nr:hypothetical protein [Anaerolineae bacterium]